MNRFRFCECGCERVIKGTTIEKKQKRFIHGHSGNIFLKGKDNPAFNFGFTKHSDGRIAIRTRKGGNIFWYRVVMENILFNRIGKYRSLTSKEAVHHENENFLDDSPNNLKLKGRGIHSIDHSKGKPRLWVREFHSKPVFLYKKECSIIQEFNSAKEASVFLGLHPNTVSGSIRKRVKVRGWIPQYLE